MRRRNQCILHFNVILLMALCALHIYPIHSFRLETVNDDEMYIVCFACIFLSSHAMCRKTNSYFLQIFHSDRSISPHLSLALGTVFHKSSSMQFSSTFLYSMLMCVPHQTGIWFFFFMDQHSSLECTMVATVGIAARNKGIRLLTAIKTSTTSTSDE